MTKLYYSIYGPLIEQFLEFKRGIGYKYKDADWVLSGLDRFAVERDESEIGMSKDFLVDYCRQGLNESDKSRYNRMQMVRQFSMFLGRLGYDSYVPRLPKFRSTFTPYIFSKKEIADIFSACDRLKATKRQPKYIYYIAPLLFRLLYGTGLRLGEALDLRRSDINLKAGHVILRNCKNGKDRMVPMSASLTQVFYDYLRYRQCWIERTHKSIEYVFIRPDGDACDPVIVYKLYRKILFKAGISHGGRGKGPRLHDIRHTAAVHALESMASAGLDLYYSLPILSTYLGHDTLMSTDKYVRLTSEMYPSVINNANKVCPFLFPELYKKTEDETY